MPELRHPDLDRVLTAALRRIRARAGEAARIDPAYGHHQLTLLDDPEEQPRAYANPCRDRNGNAVYAIWYDGDPVGIATSWPEAAAVIALFETPVAA